MDSMTISSNWAAGATVARSTPDRKVIRSNRVWLTPTFAVLILF